MFVTTRDELPQYLKDRGYKVGAEIGVYKGEFIEKLCKAGLKVYGVDPYITYPNYRKHPKEPDYETMYQDVLKLAESYDCMIIKKTSMDALGCIADNSLDFVYIDGNHSLPYITQDIFEWNKKVRSGGVIAGHDYFNDNHNPYWIRACHVKYAVDVCAKIFNIDLQVIKGRDKCPSWLWIKP